MVAGCTSGDRAAAVIDDKGATATSEPCAVLGADEAT